MLDAMGVGALAPNLGRVGRKFFKTPSQGYKEMLGPTLQAIIAVAFD